MVAWLARGELQKALGSWPEISERTVRLYQAHGIVSPARGSGSNSYHTPLHALEVAIGSVAASLRTVSLQQTAEEVAKKRRSGELPQMLEALIEQWKSERAWGAPRPLPGVRMDAHHASPAMESVVRLTLSEGVVITAPHTALQTHEDFPEWLKLRVQEALGHK